MLAHEQYRTKNSLQLILFLTFPKGLRDLAINYGKCIDAAQMLVFLAHANTIFILSPLLLSHHTKATKEGHQKFVSYLEDKETINVSKRKKNFQMVNHARQTWHTINSCSSLAKVPKTFLLFCFFGNTFQPEGKMFLKVVVLVDSLIPNSPGSLVHRSIFTTSTALFLASSYLILKTALSQRDCGEGGKSFIIMQELVFPVPWDSQPSSYKWPWTNTGRWQSEPAIENSGISCFGVSFPLNF